MFAMYDDDGLNFRSTIDKLYTIRETSPSLSVKNNRDRDESGRNFHDALYNSKEGNITKEATDAYKQVTNIDHGTEIYHVNQIMTSPVLTAKSFFTVSECYNIMVENKIQQLPVMADDDVHIKGIISLQDILKMIMEEKEFVQMTLDKKLEDIELRSVITTDPISDIRRVSKVMIDFKFNSIPVVNTNDVLVGIVTRNNILKAVSSLPHLQIWA
jgi:CBS domain-containing protein